MLPQRPSNHPRKLAHSPDIAPSEVDLSTNQFPQERRVTVDHRRVGHGALVLVVVIVGIVFGSLYPFNFRTPANGIGPVLTLVESWAERPSRSDFLANVLLYIPVGTFAILAQRRRAGSYWPLLHVILAGGALSITMELLQYFDVGRVTNASDVYSNTLGTAVGAVAGIVFRGNSRFLLIDQLLSKPLPTLLVGAWMAYRLYPYEPTIDLHKYWNALKPVVLSPSLGAYDLYRHTVIWLTLFALITAITGERRGRGLVVLFSGGVLLSQVLIIDVTLSVAEIAGAAVALCVWPVLVSRRWRDTLLVALLAVYVIAERLEPFDFSPFSHPFGWVPFVSFIAGGSNMVNTLSFCEKVFLYGGLLFLLTEAGLRLGLAALLVATFLFVTSWLETHLPGRSAEITDAVMALLIAIVFALLRPERSERPLRPGTSAQPTKPNHRRR